MQIFTQVIESGNFTRAAQALGLPRSTVSTTVQSLEDRLGVQLLQRTTRVVRPTQEGLQFAESARDLIDAMAQAEGQFRHQSTEISGRLRIDMPSRMARRMVIPNLHDFHARYPLIDLDISATDRMIDLIADGVDAVVRLAEPQDSELICRKIGDVPILTCAGKGYIARYGMPRVPADLRDHFLVNYAPRRPAPVAKWDGLEMGRPISVPMRSYLCVDNAESYVAGALHNHGLAQVPAHDVAGDLAEGHLIEVLAAYRPEPIPISILFARRRYLAPRLKVFMGWLSDLLRDEGFVRAP